MSYTDEEVKLNTELPSAVAPASAHEWLPRTGTVRQFVRVDKDQEKRKVE